MWIDALGTFARDALYSAPTCAGDNFEQRIEAVATRAYIIAETLSSYAEHMDDKSKANLAMLVRALQPYPYEEPEA